MLKWRGVWEGFGVFTWLDGRQYSEECIKLYPEAGTESSRVPAMEDQNIDRWNAYCFKSFNLLITVRTSLH